MSKTKYIIELLFSDICLIQGLLLLEAHKKHNSNKEKEHYRNLNEIIQIQILEQIKVNT